jgi:hypothetical protein
MISMQPNEYGITLKAEVAGSYNDIYKKNAASF